MIHSLNRSDDDDDLSFLVTGQREAEHVLRRRANHRRRALSAVFGGWYTPAGPGVGGMVAMEANCCGVGLCSIGARAALGKHGN